MSFTDRVAAGQAPARDAAERAMVGLIEITRQLDIPRMYDRLVTIVEEFRTDVFTITIFGRMKSGKSTLLNALLADVTHPVDLGGAPGPLPADMDPCSPLVTKLVYSTVPWVKAWAHDGTSEQWSLRKYMREAQLDPEQSAEDNRRHFADIQRFEIGYPARLLQSTELIDTPGTDEYQGRDLLAEAASESSDAILVAFRSDPPLGETEVNAAWKAVEGKLGVFTVVNVFAPRIVDRRFRGRVWNTYIRPRLPQDESAEWADQDLEGAYRIYFVDAFRSLTARQAGDTEGTRQYGLAAFEDRLADFLAHERAAAHIANHAHRADVVAGELAETIATRRRRDQQSQAEFEDWSRRMQVALYEAEQRGAVIREVMDAHRKLIVDQVVLGLRNSESRIREDLHAHLSEVDIPVLEKFHGAMMVKTVQRELELATTAFVEGRRQTWLDGTKVGLTDSLDRLRRDLARELDRAIEPVYRANLELADQDFDDNFQVVRPGEKIAAAALAVVTLNAAAAVGAGGGFQPVLAGIGGIFAGGLLLGALGVTFAAPIVIPVVLVSAMIGAFAGSWWRIRERFLKKLVPHLHDQLQAGEAELEQALTAQVEGIIDAFGAEVERRFLAELAQQREELDKQIQIRGQEHAVRAQQLRVLEGAAAAVVEHRATLADAVRTGRQQVDRAV